ncbi:MAG TPA: hypothetical protein VHM26_17275, partial [Chitinophagaceae bacterium]|nr:hypothetical protein [Chitinophagaceae bacterium]
MKHLPITVILLLTLTLAYSQTTCPPHPIFTPLANHSIRSCDAKEFDKFDFYEAKAGGGNTQLTKQGQYTTIDYKFDGEWEKRPSVTQIIQNYANATKKISGGTILLQGNSNLHVKVKKADATYWINVTSDGSGDYWVTTIREEAMRQDVTNISAAEIKKGIDEEGRVAFYGIYFDTDKATLKPESDKALAEMAKYLKENASINVYIV